MQLPLIKNRFSLAISELGELIAMGDNRRGQIGVASMENVVPVASRVEGLLLDEFVTMAAGGGDHTLVVTRSNKLFTMGSNSRVC